MDNLEWYLYNVYDTETNACIMEQKLLHEVMAYLKVSKNQIINAALYGRKLHKRYVISRDLFEKCWDHTRIAARRALQDPKAVERFLTKQCLNKSREVV